MKIFFLVASILFLVACGGPSNPSDTTPPPEPVPDPIDITNAIFVDTGRDCGDYANAYSSMVVDITRSLGFDGALTVEATTFDTCTLTSNNIPNHDFNDATAAFASDVQAVTRSFTVSRAPSGVPTPFELTLDAFDAIMLNGVVVDMLSAGCFGVGDGTTGCDDLSTPYRYDPMSPLNNFGTDAHNAHPQPDGSYHYHGNPLAMFDDNFGPEGSPVIGFAADGYPIFGSYFNDGTTIRKAVSGYTLKTGPRGAGPGGNYDGTFIDDWEFTNAGDLDQCNGMILNGEYGYYVTDTYPWILACHAATPNASFVKSAGP